MTGGATWFTSDRQNAQAPAPGISGEHVRRIENSLPRWAVVVGVR
jgi:hypothetical protein